MGMNFSTAELALRDDVRTWLAGNLPADLRTKVTQYQELKLADPIRWHKILAAKGWAVPHWPVEWGGTCCQRGVAARWSFSWPMG